MVVVGVVSNAGNKAELPHLTHSLAAFSPSAPTFMTQITGNMPPSMETVTHSSMRSVCNIYLFFFRICPDDVIRTPHPSSSAAATTTTIIKQACLKALRASDCFILSALC